MPEWLRDRRRRTGSYPLPENRTYGFANSVRLPTVVRDNVLCSQIHCLFCTLVSSQNAISLKDFSAGTCGAFVAHTLPGPTLPPFVFLRLPLHSISATDI